MLTTEALVSERPQDQLTKRDGRKINAHHNH